MTPFLLLTTAAFATAPASKEADHPEGRTDLPAPIINGVEASIDDYPMTGGTILDAHVSFSSNEMDLRVFMCTSTLIAPDVVLLAAHCLDTDALTYGMGEVTNADMRWTRQPDLSDHDGSRIADWPEDAIAAWDWAIHPGFDINNMGVGLAENDDIGLLFLDTAVTDVDHAYLIQPEEVDQIVAAATVDIVGWGQQEATNMWEAPTAGTYLLKMMGEAPISQVGDTELHIGADTEDVRKCHGDSGGPSFLEVQTDTLVTQRVIGVTSHAYDQTDCFETGGVDTRVDAYLDWIEAELVSRCEDGTRAWCDSFGIPTPPLPEPDVADGAAEDPAAGCGCATTPRPMGLVWLLPLLGLLLSGRREEPAPPR